VGGAVGSVGSLPSVAGCSFIVYNGVVV